MKFAIKFCAVALVFFVGCKQAEKENKLEISKVQELVFASFGDKISNEKVLTSKEMLIKFEDMIAGDTINIKFASEIKEVCAAKGCWMKLPLAEEKEAMVRFKDYGFFMPLDSKGKEVVLEGKAFVQTTSVAELRHKNHKKYKQFEKRNFSNFRWFYNHTFTRVRRTISF